MRLFRYISLFFLVFGTWKALALSVTQIITNYTEFCQSAANNEELFRRFRSEEPCKTIVENVNFIQGSDILHVIQEKYPHLFVYFDKICLDDRFGNPLTYNFPGVGAICPATLRYVKIAGDLSQEFGNLSAYHILEIGGGYGGQCKILHDIFGFTSYTLVDLPGCTSLIMKYLCHYQIPGVSCIPSTKIMNAKNYDLVISNYAFSEIDREEQRDYLEKMIKSVPRGYITYNILSSSHGLTSLTVDEVVTALQRENRKIMVTPENPLTGEGTVVISWFPQESIY